MNHSAWKTRRTRKLLGEEVEYSDTYIESGLAMDLGQAVCGRRKELGIS